MGIVERSLVFEYKTLMVNHLFHGWLVWLGVTICLFTEISRWRVRRR